MFKKLLITSFLAFGLLLFAGCQTDGGEGATPDLKVEPDDHINGNPNAEVTLIEYSDFECPFCKSFHATAQLLVNNYGGKVNWVFRQLPLAIHQPLASKEAEATECAADLGGNEAFWKYAELVYTRTTSNGTGLDPAKLPDMAEEIGLNKDDFTECLDSGKFLNDIQDDINSAVANGVKGTPATFILNNATGESVFVSGAQPYAGLKSVIDDMLE